MGIQEHQVGMVHILDNIQHTHKQGEDQSFGQVVRLVARCPPHWKKKILMKLQWLNALTLVVEAGTVVVVVVVVVIDVLVDGEEEQMRSGHLGTCLWNEGNL